MLLNHIHKPTSIAQAVAKERARVGDWEVELLTVVERLMDARYTYNSPEARTADVRNCIKSHVTALLAAKDREKEHVIQNIINLADELESECNNDKLGDKGTEQWRAFKGFRNTIRDRYLSN